MIVVTRLTGDQFGVNPDLVQRIDSAPDTIVTLIDGTKYIVAEPMAEVIARINEHRAAVLARSQELRATPHMALVRDDDVPAGTSAGTSAGTGDETLAPTLPLRPRSV